MRYYIISVTSLALGALTVQACVGSGEPGFEAVGTESQELYGTGVTVEEQETDGYSSAVGALFYDLDPNTQKPVGTFCSGTLVRPRRVVTALHCVPPDAQIPKVWFPQNGGFYVEVTEVKSIPGAPIVNEESSREDFKTDIAVLVLKDEVPRWIAEAIPIRLDDVQGIFDDVSGHKGLDAGWGGNIRYDNPAGGGRRRVGQVGPLSWEDSMWTFQIEPDIFSACLAKGDSGGGLFRQFSAEEFELVGVNSGYWEEYDWWNDITWVEGMLVPTGDKGPEFRQFLVDALTYIPIEPEPAFALTDVAVYGTKQVTINDRAVIRKVGGGNANVARGGVRAIDLNTADLGIGADAKVGNVWVNDNARAADRSTLGKVVTEGTLFRGNNVSTSSVTIHTHSGMPALDLPSWPSSTTSKPEIFVNSTYEISPESGDVVYEGITVNRGGVLKIKPSSKPYYIGKLDLEPGGQILVDTSQGPVRLHVRDAIIFRGDLVDTNTSTVGDIFLGYYGKSAVSLERPMVATVVAPNASLSLDAYGYVFQGAFMARTVTVHQAITVYHRPFEWAEWAP